MLGATSIGCTRGRIVAAQSQRSNSPKCGSWCRHRNTDCKVITPDPIFLLLLNHGDNTPILDVAAVQTYGDSNR